MKRFLKSSFPSIPLALTVLGVVGASCGLRETKSSSTTSLLGQIQKASNAGAVTATPKTSVQIDELKKQLRDATEFWRLSLEKESKERKDADDAIRADVLTLNEKLEALRGRLDSEIARLDKTLREEFDGKLKAQEASLTAKISAETSARESALKAVDESLRSTKSELEGKIGSLDTKTQESILNTNKALADAEARLKALLETTNAETLATLNKTKDQLISDMKGLEDRANKSLDSVKSELADMIKVNDDAANAKFAELQNQLKLAKSALESKQASLKMQMDTANAELKAALSVSNQALTDRIHTLDLVTQGQLATVKTELETKILNNGSELTTLISLARDEAQKNLVTAVGEQNAQLISVMTKADNALRAELSSKIATESATQAAALQSFKREVDATYAKQVDLITLQGVVNGLTNALNILDHKVDDNDKRLNESVKNMRMELVDKIGNVQASVTALRGDFVGHVNEYNSKVSELAEQTRQAARDLRAEMATSAVHDETQRAKLQASIEALSVKLTNTEDFAIKTRDALTGKIVELERRDGELSNEVRDARNEATAQLSAAIAKEQQARQAIADDVKKLQAEVERVSQVANQALSLSKANELAVAGLKTDLEEAKVRWDSQLKELRGEMENQIADIRAQSQLIIRGLGLDAQTHFAETATQLADVKNKVAGLLVEMGRAIEKGIQLSSDPVVKSGSAERAAAFNKKVSKDLSQSWAGKTITLQDLASQRMDDFSKVLGRVESEFLLAIDYAEVLNDDQKTSDLYAMNASFIEKVVSLTNTSGVEVCAGGSKGDVRNNIPLLMSSVNNNEFWQHLARAYVQMVVSGSRTGNAEFDKIFHGTGALTDGQSFQSALAMASVPSMASGAGGECISRVNDWAKSIIFGNGAVSVRLRNALVARSGLKRLLNEGSLEAAYKGLASPATSIEAIAKETLKPAFGNDDAKVTSYLRSGDVAKGDPGFYATASQILQEYGTSL
ncbi:MAG: hypothetical protein RI953_2447, partial [Pseudomonadota bacterium]